MTHESPRLAGLLLHSALFAACCSVSLCTAAEAVVLRMPVVVFSPLHLLLFGATICEYNVHALVHSGVPHKPLHTLLQRLPLRFLALAAMGGAVAFYGFCQVQRAVQVVFLLLAVLSLAYSIPAVRLRTIGIFKVVLLAVTWVATTTILPALNVAKPISLVYAECGLRMLLILPLCIAFAIRDRNKDKATLRHGLVSILGAQKAETLSRGLLGAFWLLGTALHPAGAIVFFVTVLYSVFAIRMAVHTGKAGWYHIGVDGAMLLYALLSLMCC